MASTKARNPKIPQAPRQKTLASSIQKRWLPYAVGAAVVVVAVVVFAVQGNTTTGTAPTSAGLPSTSDYHSLLVAADDPNALLLGTHQGIYRSADGGRHWAAYRLGGQDAMNLARPISNGTIWMAGHQVFAKSTDGGNHWQPLQPASLPSLDLHGFAVDPRNPKTVYAAVAGVGLYRSDDSAVTFKQVSLDVGGNVMALGVTPRGEILAGDMQRGLLASRDRGKTWKKVLNAQLAGLAINPSNPQQILAAGPGIFRSVDGGSHWAQVARIAAGAGPVTWSVSNPRLAFAVGFDRVLYRSTDSGAHWAPVV
jgi:photosystem II stability/assembly factor-like uncharacterized protein